MPRSAKCRRVCQLPAHCRFSPEQPAQGEAVVLAVEEYETIRLVDFQGLTQEEAAVQMGVARATVQRIYAQARQKLAAFLVEGRPLQIGGGSYAICRRKNCRGCGGPVPLPKRKGCRQMKIAVTYENGNVYGHFGHTEQFKIYDIVDGTLADAQVVPTNGSGHGALAGFLTDHGVDCLICGGIGPGAQTALAEAGIKLYAGCSGDADQCVTDLLAGTLAYAEAATCDHHHGEEGHTCGDHGCGEHHCGNH
ncbi:DUF134 domain-containing protein [uncultured Dysosmobacter sp.]|uniref:DUF134 domain-containing protein n=1 Tax=uncultured Dysosmobacter sp. TaxID=2591384 RepID=UPI0026338528|nr:DUF134 domain-containing protein [uncultured Dysosmobacter sp.]